MLKKIIETIRIERLRQKMTLKELSEVSTVSVKQICEIENEKVTPSLKTLEKLAQPLGFEIKVYITTADNKLAKAAGE
jgi:transcriptional regulator with XRE-family HTH domain